MSNVVPHAIGIIMDGNRRWARERGLPTPEGHHAGFEKLRDVVGWAADAGVREVTVYAFSTENWNRSPEEVAYLLELFEMAFEKGLEPLIERGCAIRFIGDHTHFSETLQQKMRELTERSASGTAGTLIVALSYGGRDEIVAATNKLLASGVVSVDATSFAEALDTAGLADPDLIIRTGGEQRLSNFLSWQSVYSELFFTDTKWPDFSHEEFIKILEWYATRDRRHGR